MNLLQKGKKKNPDDTSQIFAKSSNKAYAYAFAFQITF